MDRMEKRSEASVYNRWNKHLSVDKINEKTFGSTDAEKKDPKDNFMRIKPKLWTQEEDEALKSIIEK